MDALTYEYAQLAAARDSDPDDRRRVRSRIADYYLRGAIAASSHLSQRWVLSPLYREDPQFPLPEFTTHPDAPASGVNPVTWTRENLSAIMACMERAGRVWEPGGPVPGYRWQMAEATNAYFTLDGRNDERATILAWAEEDADACRDLDALARIQAQWGEMLLGQGQLDEAETRFTHSLDAARQGQERRGIGAAMEWLGITERRRGNAVQALRYFDLAQPFLDPARLRSQALLHMHRADAQAVLGDTRAALASYAAAAGLFRRLAAEGTPDQANEGKILAGKAELLVSTVDAHLKFPRPAH